MSRFAIENFDEEVIEVNQVQQDHSHDDIYSAHASVLDAENEMHDCLYAGAEGIETAECVDEMISHVSGSELSQAEGNAVATAIESLLACAGKPRSEVRYVGAESFTQTARTIWIKLVAFIKKIAGYVSYYVDSVFNMDKIVAFKLKRLQKQAQEVLKSSEAKKAHQLPDNKRYVKIPMKKYMNVFLREWNTFNLFTNDKEDVVLDSSGRIVPDSLAKCIQANMSIPFDATIKTTIRTLMASGQLLFLLDDHPEDVKRKFLIDEMTAMWDDKNSHFNKHSDMTRSGTASYSNRMFLDKKEIESAPYAGLLDRYIVELGKLDTTPLHHNLKPKTGFETREAECIDLDSIDKAIEETIKQIDGNQALRKLSLETKKLVGEYEKKINERRTEANTKEVKLISKNMHACMRVTIGFITLYMRQHTLFVKFMAFYLANSLRCYQ